MQREISHWFGLTDKNQMNTIESRNQSIAKYEEEKTKHQQFVEKHFNNRQFYHALYLHDIKFNERNKITAFLLTFER